MTDGSITMWDVVMVGRQEPPRVPGMSSVQLTKRRAVDHCRMRSALCRMP